MAEVQFVEGLKFYRPSDNAPDWILANVVADVTTLTNWLNDNANPEGKVRLQLKQGKSGAIYMAKDTYVPRQKDAMDNFPPPVIDYPKEEIDPNDVPF